MQLCLVTSMGAKRRNMLGSIASQQSLAPDDTTTASLGMTLTVTIRHGTEPESQLSRSGREPAASSIVRVFLQKDTSCLNSLIDRVVDAVGPTFICYSRRALSLLQFICSLLLYA